MRVSGRLNHNVGRGCRAAALAMLLLSTTSAFAQVGDAPDAPEADASNPEGDIIITGSRIGKAGFDQPTPTTVLGEVDLRMGARANIQQVLNDQPQFRPTVSPTVSVGNTSSGTAPVDLRGLGTVRTLTLLNGRRFVGENNLNLIPSGLVERVEVVTGGASAAYGSGAVAGVVNIILDNDLEGIELSANSGISSRGDAQRYSFAGTFGTHFADDKGHFMIGAEYVDDHGIKDRNSRRNLGSSGIVSIGNGQTELVRDVNYTNRSAAGVITNGVLAGQTFNPDGTIRPWQGPNAQGVGGADGIGLYDDVYGASPFKRYNVYARGSYDIGNAEIWIDGTYGRSESEYPFFPDLVLSSQSISVNNAFLRPEVRQQLVNAGQTSFTLGRVFNDVFLNTFNGVRENKEGAIGIDGHFADDSLRYRAYYSHGELTSDEKMRNARIAANYSRAINAVSSNGQIVCAVNADAITTNDDPACVPLNILGNGVASQAALDYVQGVQAQRVVSKLDVAAAEVQGDLIQLPAGALTVAIGGEMRWESQSTQRDALTATAGYFGFPVFAQDIKGDFDVMEGYMEVAAPLLDIEDKFQLDFNGAARYSDYSFSGGIWSWKAGGTARVFNDLLLRLTRSRDIRAPNINNLFSTRGTTVGTVSDQDNPAARKAANPAYNPTPSQVFTYSGGNPDLVPEVSSTLTIGGSYSPSFLPGFQLSVDYYDIDIDDAIVTLNGSQLTLACRNGAQAACDRVIRDSNGTITTVFANAANIATFATTGVDIEASYMLPVPSISTNGTLRFRALATYIDSFVYDTGVSRTDFVGQVGNTVAQGVPEWRASLSATYQDDIFGFDARVRYVDGGVFDRSLLTLVNNAVSSRTYVDLGAQFKVQERLTFTASVNNLFDVAPPLSTAGPVHYDAIGTYFNFGARLNF